MPNFSGHYGVYGLIAQISWVFRLLPNMPGKKWSFEDPGIYIYIYGFCIPKSLSDFPPFMDRGAAWRFVSGKLGGCRCPTISWRHHMQITWYCLIFFLVGGIPVVSIPLWKIWVRQLGWWNSQLIWKSIWKIFKTTNQLVCMIYVYNQITDHVIHKCSSADRWWTVLTILAPLLPAFWTCLHWPNERYFFGESQQDQSMAVVNYQAV